MFVYENEYVVKNVYEFLRMNFEDWQRFFEKANGKKKKERVYFGTGVEMKSDQHNIFRTRDFWIDPDSYYSFRKRNSEEYEELHRRHHEFIENEKEIGWYQVIF